MSWLISAAASVGNSPLWVKILLLVLFLLLILFIFIQIWRYGVRRAKLPKNKDPKTELNYVAQNMKSSFIAAHHAMKDFFPGLNYKYSTPVFLLIGPEDSEKTELMNEAGLSSQLGHTVTGNPCTWSIFDRATVVDVRGEIIFGGTRGSKTNKQWSLFVNLFQRFRPQRPLDGIIIAMPAKSILDQTFNAKEALTETAETIHRSIGELQSKLGMALPIYLIITKSEDMAGFSEAASMLPDEYSSEAFGWASPYPSGAAYSNDWCEEALRELVPRVQTAINESLTLSNPNDNDRNDAILFPSSIERLKDSLEIFLGTVLRVSNFNKSASLRGIFFTGAITDSQLSPETSVNLRRSFVHGLLERKIFPEFALAIPLNLKLLSTNKRVRFAQFAFTITILLGIVGLMNASIYLDESSRRLTASVTAISASAEQLRLAHQDGLSTLDLVSVGEAVSVMNRLEAIGETDLQLTTVPTTWFDNLPSQIVEVMNLAYDKFLYEEMHLWLTARGTEIANSAPDSKREFLYYHDTKAPIVKSKDRAINDDSPSPDFSIVDGYLEQLSTFERMVTNYERIQPDKDTIALRTVAKYLYDIDLTAEFVESVAPTLFGGRTNNVPPVNLENLKSAARSKMELVWENLIYNWVSRDGLVDQLVDLSSAVNIQYDKESISKTDYQRLRKIRITLGKLKKNLNSGRYDWIANKKPILTKGLDERLKTIEAQGLLGPQSKEQLIARFNEIHRVTRSRLLQFPMPDIGSVIIVKDGKLKLANHLDSLHIKLVAAELQDGRNNAKVEEKLSQIDTMIPTKAPNGQHVVWDVQVLNAALSDAKNYEEIFYQNPQTSRSKNSMDETVSRLTGYGLSTRIASQINIAIKFKRTPYSSDLKGMEDAISERVANFSMAIKPLQSLFEILGQNASKSIYINSTELAISEALEIIKSTDRLLLASNPYSARNKNFSKWDGATPPLRQLIGLRGNGQIDTYVDQQRQRIEFLAREYVAPALNFLLKTSENRVRPSIRNITKWQSILEDLNSYDTMQADNAIFRLEAFIGDFMGAKDCQSVDELIIKPANDFSWFTDRLKRLKTSLTARCVFIRSRDLSNTYAALSRRFNETLSGKAPFSLGSFYGSSVSESVVKSYLKDFDRFLNNGGGDPMLMNFTEDKGQAERRFIDRMDKVAFIFNQAENLEDPKAPNMWMIEPQFRVNQAYEVGGSQVIGWEVTSGESSASLYGGGKRIKWSVGEDIKIKFSWALNAKTRPVGDPKRSDLFIDGRTAIFSYKNEWALFSAIERNRTAVFNVAEDEKENFHILHFKIPTVLNSAQNNASNNIPTGKTEIFVALRIYGSESKGAPRLMIPTMPAQAPSSEVISKRSK